MKRYITFILISAAILAGCNGADDGIGYDSRERTVFEAVVENGPQWELGDQIGVYGSDQGANERYVVTRASVGTSGPAEIYGPVVKGSRFMAYYPYDPEYVGGTADALPMHIEGAQTYDNDMMRQYWAHVPMAAGSLGDDGVFHLVYPLGIMAVELHFETVLNVRTITLKSSSLPLAGDISIVEGGRIAPTFTSEKSLTLDCGPDGVLTKEDGSFTRYYFIAPPGEYPAMELRIVISTLEGGEYLVHVPEAVTVERLKASDYHVLPVILTSVQAPGFGEQDGTITIN